MNQPLQQWARGTMTPSCPCCGEYLLPCTVDKRGIHPDMTVDQATRLRALCACYNVDQPTYCLVYPADSFTMPGWVEVIVDGVTFGISPEGEAHS